MGNGPSSFYIRMARPSDAPECHAVDVEAWGAKSAASIEMFEQRIAHYPYGNFVAVDRGHGGIIGSVWSVSTSADPSLTKTWEASTGGGIYDGVCDVHGPHIFGVNLASRKAVSGADVGRQLTIHCVKAAWISGKVSFMLGARIPEYKKWRDAVSATDYIRLFRMSRKSQRVFFRDEAGLLREGPEQAEILSQQSPADPQSWPILHTEPRLLLPMDEGLGFFLGIRVDGVRCRLFRILPEYFEDPPSCNYGVLVGWENPDLK